MKSTRAILIGSLALALGACGGGSSSSDSSSSAATSYTVGGSVSGLTGSLQLEDNGGESITVSGSNFTFPTGQSNGSAYAVTIQTQPTGQQCAVSNGSGSVGSSNVTNVSISCTTLPTSFAVGGTVSGLSSGASLVLNNIGGSNQTVSTNGSFSVASSVNTGTTYSVSVATQPTGENCTVSNGAGTVGSASVTNITVACTSATPPPTSGTPTAGFSSSASDATSLSSLVLPAANSLVQASYSSGLPLGVLVTPPNGVTSTTTISCSVSGSATETFSIANPTVGISAGDSVAFVFNECSFVSGEVVNGSASITYTSYTNSSNFVFTFTGSDLSVVESGTTYGPYSYTGTITDVGGVVSWTYAVDGSTIAGTPVVTTTATTATITSGTINVNYGSGWVTITFTDWSYDLATGLPNPGGTCTITGSDGNSATVTVTSTGYDVSLDISGTTTSYVIPF
jgi:hypothetical protein